MAPLPSQKKTLNTNLQHTIPSPTPRRGQVECSHWKTISASIGKLHELTLYYVLKLMKIINPKTIWIALASICYLFYGLLSGYCLSPRLCLRQCEQFFLLAVFCTMCSGSEPDQAKQKIVKVKKKLQKIHNYQNLTNKSFFFLSKLKNAGNP